MKGPQGVRSRLTVSTVLVTAGAMAVMLLVVMFATDRLASSQVRTSLDSRITTAVSTLTADQGDIVPPQTGDDEVLDSVWIFDASGAEVSGPVAGDRIQDEIDRLSSVQERTAVQRGERVYVARPITIPDDRTVRGVAVASESLEPYEDSRNLLLGVLGVVALLVVLGTAAATAWTVSRTLRPVSAMTDAADEWSASDLQTRFGLVGDDELSRLGRTLDGLLDRVAQAIRTEQQLTSELAHELRTPLTAIRGEAELALLSDPGGADRERFTLIVELVDRLSTTISTLLDVARHTPGSGRRADVGAVVSALVGAFPESSVTVRVSADPGLEVSAAPELVDRVVGPIIDNAMRYARSSVEVAVRRRDGRVVVEIADDGAGVDAADVDDVFVAGFRHSEDPEGAGLGLALSRRVAGTIGGTVAITSFRDPTTFTVDLPGA